jgi:IclR family acetate operon transcriptional repressor
VTIHQEGKTKGNSSPTSSIKSAEEEAKFSAASFSTSVAKAFSIIEILASCAESGISLTELSTLLNMPKSTAYRYLATLLELHLAERGDTDRFRLGTKVIELAGSFLASSDIRKESEPILEEMAEKTGETVHLAVPSGSEVVYIAKLESKYTIGMASHIGTRLPMRCTALGKSILAFSGPDLIQAVFSEPPQSHTPDTITSNEALKAELDLIRTQGFAIDNQENEVGICCVGAPILDYTGRAIAAMSISGPCDRMDRERCVQLGPLLWEAALKISKRKGYTGKLTTNELDRVPDQRVR